MRSILGPPAICRAAVADRPLGARLLAAGPGRLDLYRRLLELAGSPSAFSANSINGNSAGAVSRPPSTISARLSQATSSASSSATPSPEIHCAAYRDERVVEAHTAFVVAIDRVDHG